MVQEEKSDWKKRAIDELQKLSISVMPVLLSLP